MSQESLVARRIWRREYQRRRRQLVLEMSQEVQAQYRLRNVVSAQRRRFLIRASETEGQAAERRAREAERVRNRRANETEEQRVVRRARGAEQMRNRRANETDEQRTLRRAREATKVRNRRANETEEQRALRRAREAERFRNRRVINKEQGDQQRAREARTCNQTAHETLQDNNVVSQHSCGAKSQNCQLCHSLNFATERATDKMFTKYCCHKGAVDVKSKESPVGLDDPAMSDMIQIKLQSPVQVRLKQLPFYDVLEEIMKPTSLIPQNGKRIQEKQFVFHLTPKQVQEISMSRDIRQGAKCEYTVQVQVRFCLEDTTCDQGDMFPSQIQMQVNNTPATLSNVISVGGPNTKTRKCGQPVDITNLCQLSDTVSNAITVTWAAEYNQSFCMSVYLVRRLSADILLAKLKDFGSRHPGYTKAIIKEKMAQYLDSGISTSSVRMSLKCPLGKMRMQVPCRASVCIHLQCFDAFTFLTMNEQKPTWLCPVCYDPCPFDKLIIDGYFSEIIRHSPSCNSIIFHKDGSWSPEKPSSKSAVMSQRKSCSEVILMLAQKLRSRASADSLSSSSSSSSSSPGLDSSTISVTPLTDGLASSGVNVTRPINSKASIQMSPRHYISVRPINSQASIQMNPQHYISVRPRVRLKPLIFYDVLEEIMEPTHFKHRNNGIQERRFVFHLTPKQSAEIIMSRDVRPGAKCEYTVQVQVRFCLLDTTCEQDDFFPSRIHMRVNNKPASLPIISSDELTVEPRQPGQQVDITDLCRMQFTREVSNTISVIWAVENAKNFCISVYLVRRLSADILLHRLKDFGNRHSDYTKALIKEKLAQDLDNEIVTTSLRVSLMCPLGKKNIQTPCRASTCTHLQCFDAFTFLMMNEQKPTWMCPVCDHPCHFDKLIIDRYFVEIIEQSPSCNDIIFHEDGSWSPVKPLQESSSQVILADTQNVRTPSSPHSVSSKLPASSAVIDTPEKADLTTSRAALENVSLEGPVIDITLDSPDNDDDDVIL